MIDIGELARVLSELASSGVVHAELPGEEGEELEFYEGGKNAPYRVYCDEYTIYVKKSIENPPLRLYGLDASTRMARLTGVDVLISTGALFGDSLITIPGSIVTRWIGIRIRYSSDEALSALDRAYDRFYTKSRFTSEYFDSRFSDKVFADEVRLSVENELLRYWRENLVDSSDFILIDGPIYPIPVLIFRSRRYAGVYSGIVLERISLLRGAEEKALGVVKRLSQSKYLSACTGYEGTDEFIVRKEIEKSKEDLIYIGTLKVETEIGERVISKYLGYLARRIGGAIYVLRIEGLKKDIVEQAAEWLMGIVATNGLPIHIAIADRISKRLSAAAYLLVLSSSPLEPTYEALEGLDEVRRELEI